uniref:Alanine racemase n=1 Tax=candidate division WOR-3 bacterium TaxID=2052148 RepID=A0A7C1RZD8_UNCW3
MISVNRGRIWAEIDLDALRHNIVQVRSAIGSRKLLFAIKADAYGHGLREIARAARNFVDAFGVASVEEGVSCRHAGVTDAPVLILSPVPEKEIPELFEYRLIPTVSDEQFALTLAQEAQRRQTAIPVHIEVDTGMGRTGVSLNQALDFITRVASLHGITLAGVFTHFPAADTDIHFTRQQVQEFNRLTAQLEHRGITGFLRHAANSAGCLNIPEAQLDMVRPGLMLYGIMPLSYHFGHRQAPFTLKPVMSLRSRIVNLREFPAGTSISYERNYFTTRDSRIAVISAGYGDGYPHSLTNKGYCLLHGRKVPVVGNVSMDLTMLDVTDVPETKLGDVVTLLGSADGKKICANELALLAGTIPYEIICRVSPRVPRIYLQDGKVVHIKTLLNYD